MIYHETLTDAVCYLHL